MPEEKSTASTIREHDEAARPAKMTAEDRERQKKVDALRDLELEDAVERADRRRATKADRETKRAAYQSSLREELIQREARAEACTHRKGGKVGLSGGMQALTAGNDPNYSVIKHTLPDGEILVICQRCPKEWRKPNPALAKSKDADVRAQYKEDFKEYQWALRLPTDNESSGTHMFLIQRAA